MKAAKALWYGMFVNHHLNKITRLSKAHTTAIKYHHEMSLHYFKKAFDKELEKPSNDTTITERLESIDKNPEETVSWNDIKRDK